MHGRIATVFQIDLDVAQGTEVYDVGLQLAARKNVDSTAGFPREFLQDFLDLGSILVFLSLSFTEVVPKLYRNT